MKFDILRNDIRRFFRSTIREFPITISSSIVAALALVYYIQFSEDLHVDPWVNLAVTAVLGISLFFSIEALEQMQPNFRFGLLTKLFIGLILVIYFMYLPEDWNPRIGIHTFVFFVSTLLLAAFLPVFDASNDVFWSYNLRLFQNILVAFVLVLLFWIGLALSLKALEFLFGLRIHDKLYAQMAVLLGGVFLTIIFTHGYDRDQITQSPQSLKPYIKKLSSFLLFPLLSIYFVILYSYMIKTTVETTLPKGWITKLVLMYSGLSIFTYLLIYPLKGRALFFKKYIFYTMPAAIIFLFIAIYRRIGDYGITFPRYYVALMGVWLAVIAIGFIFFRPRIKLRFIPISLWIFCLFAAFSPWSAFSVAKKNQQKRILEGLRQLPGSSDPQKLNNQIVSSLYYLQNNHGKASLVQLVEHLGLDIDEQAVDAQTIRERLNLKEVRLEAQYQNEDIFSIASTKKRNDVITIVDGIYFIRFPYFMDSYDIDGRRFQFKVDKLSDAEFIVDDQSYPIELDSWMDELSNKYNSAQQRQNISPQDMIFSFGGIPGYQIDLSFDYINRNPDNLGLNIQYIVVRRL